MNQILGSLREKINGVGSRPVMIVRSQLKRVISGLVGLLVILASTGGSYSQEPLTLSIDCEQATVTFTNNTGVTDIEVKLVTGAFRGFTDPGAPAMCPDVSYWETRFPSVVEVAGGLEESGSLAIPYAAPPIGGSLNTFLPDNFGVGAPRPASDCEEYILSLSVKYTDPLGQPFEDMNGDEYPEATASCKSSGTFTKPTLDASQREDVIRARMVFGSRIDPFGEGQIAGQCGAGDSSVGIVHNRSLSTAVQGIWSGKFVCKKGNDDALLGTTGVCKTGTGVPLGPNDGRGIRAKIRGFRLEPDDCGGMRVNPTPLGFPTCCDCYDGACGASVVLQCVRGVVTGEILPGDSEFTFFEPFIFLPPKFDLEPRSETDSSSPVSGTPSRDTLAMDCTEFALSDLKGFVDDDQVFAPLNLDADRYEFDYAAIDNDETNQCTNRCAKEGVGSLDDFDLNGVDDSCQHIGVTRYDAGMNREVVVRKRIRNIAYNGDTYPEPTSPPDPIPDISTFSNLTLGGELIPFGGSDTSSDLRYDEILALQTPGGFSIPSNDAILLFDGDIPASEITYDAFDVLFAGVLTGAGSSLHGFELNSRTQIDLVVEERKPGPSWPTPVRGAGIAEAGGIVYGAAGDQIFVYDSRCLSKVQGATPTLSPPPSDCIGYEIGQTLGTDAGGTNVEPYAVAVEPDDEYTYVVSGSADIHPGEGWISAISRADHSVIADPGAGQTLFSAITGTPTDVAAVNIGTGGDRDAIVYVASQIVAGGGCPGSGGGGGGSGGGGPGGGITPLGGATTFHRRTFLSAHAMSRPDFAQAARFADTAGEIEFDCQLANLQNLSSIKLDTAQDGRIFMISEGIPELFTIDTNQDGSLDANSVISTPLGWFPTDVFVGDGPDPLFEIAVVVGNSNGGKIWYFKNTDDLLNKLDFSPAGASHFTSVAVSDSGLRAYVGDDVQGEVRILDLFSEVVETDSITINGALGELTIQRKEP